MFDWVLNTPLGSEEAAVKIGILKKPFLYRTSPDD